MSKTNKSSKKTVYLVIIFLLLLINLVGAYYLFKGQQDLEVTQTELVGLQDDLSGLQANFNAQLAELDEMKGINADLDAVLAEREGDIKLHLEEIQKWKNQSEFNKNELNKLKGKIIEFETERAAFIGQIDKLSEENQELLAIKMRLETDLMTEKNVTLSLTQDKAYLSEKFELGSLLQADELSAVGIKVKDSGVEKEISKVKNVEKIMVCYQTGENKVREEGEVVMQLRLVSPNGETLFLQQEGSGSFTSKENGQEIRFSKAASFNFDGGNKKVCIYWSHNITQAGTYTAEMYQEGYLLGMTSFELK